MKADKDCRMIARVWYKSGLVGMSDSRSRSDCRERCSRSWSAIKRRKLDGRRGRLLFGGKKASQGFEGSIRCNAPRI